MGQIHSRARDEIDVAIVGSYAPDEYRPHLSELELQACRRRYFPDRGQELELFEMELQPHTVVHPHAHSADEIIYVVEGEFVLGRKTFGVGSTVFIGANTLYGFQAGNEGLRFLNFRGEVDNRYLSKAEFLARRSGHGEPAP